MEEIKSFKDFGIQPKLKTLTGEKIKIERVLNTEITVWDYRIEPSKFTGRCLYLQIEYKNEKRVIFSASTVLIELIEQIPKTGFPFKTTIIKNDERFEFT